MSATHQSKPGDPSFDNAQKIMKMYCDNANTYIKLGGAALAITLAFTRQILHVPDDKNIADIWMIIMWSCFLLTVLAGAFYQYLAVKYLEEQLEGEYFRLWGWIQAGYVYGVMLISFYGGTVTFTIYAIVHLRHQSP
jgi:hypothetical protein